MEITTLYDLIKSELYIRGFDELVNEGKFTFYNEEYAFMKKVARFDEDVQKIINDLFQNERLLDDEADKHFKRLFVTNFIDRSIKTQTVEMFSNRIVKTFMMNDEFINHVYDINSFLTGETTSESDNENESKTIGSNNSENVNKNASANLPQSQSSFNINDDEIEYPNEVNTSKNRDTSSNESETNSKGKNKTINRTYSLDNLAKIKGMLEVVFIDFDKNCFMQTF